MKTSINNYFFLITELIIYNIFLIEIPNYNYLRLLIIMYEELIILVSTIAQYPCFEFIITSILK
jgi:hypothetical protein